MPGVPPTNIFHVPKIQPGNPNFSIKSTTSMAPPVQTVQPSQWDLAAPGLKPMKTSSAYEFGQHTALEKLGMAKEAAGLLGGVKGMWNAMGSGWAGRGAAGRIGTSGVAGGMHNAQQYMTGMMGKNPGTAAGLIGLGAAGATGAGILGAHAVFGGNNQQGQR